MVKSKSQMAFERISAEKKKNPDESIAKISERLKLRPALYYAVKRRAAIRTGHHVSKPRIEKVTVQRAISGSDQVMMFVGSPEQLLAVAQRLGSL